MSATTHDLFGNPAEIQPATPGSYGEAPRGYRLPEATHLGAVRLQVGDLGRSLVFYQEALGFRLLDSGAGRARLAPQGADRALVELQEYQDARPADGRHRLGLYHFAILLPTRADLGRLVRHLAGRGLRLGAGDHSVSEAFYLHDPDGLGIEIYADRPRSQWRRVGRELMVTTDPVDVEDVVRAAGDAPWTGMPSGTVIGHVHLHVGDLARAAAFFSEALGFDRMTWRYPGALFLGAGGYHHHLGTNTWAGSAARPPVASEPQLLAWTIELPDAADVARATESLEAAGYAVERTADGEVVTHDPWGTAIRLRTIGRTAPNRGG